MDWVAVVAVLLFAIKGIRDGTVRQVFALLGWIGGIGSLIVVSQWVGAHWVGARPAVVFGLLRWLVALMVGLAVSAIFQILGERLAQSTQKSVMSGFDRLGGMVIGFGMGVVFVAVVLVAMLMLPWPPNAARAAASARLTAPVLAASRAVLNDERTDLPATEGVRKLLREASRRAERFSRQS